MVVENHKEQMNLDFENTKKGFIELMNEYRVESKNNPTVVEIIEKIQTAALKQIVLQQQKMAVECKNVSQEIERLKFSVGPNLDDPHAIPPGAQIPTLVQWFWLDDKGKFVPYDTQTTILIEIQYQKTPKGSVKLSHGFFGKNPSGYLIDFTKMQQTQCETNFSRPVQRRLNWITYAEHKKKIFELRGKMKTPEDTKPKKE